MTLHYVLLSPLLEILSVYFCLIVTDESESVAVNARNR